MKRAILMAATALVALPAAAQTTQATRTPTGSWVPGQCSMAEEVSVRCIPATTDRVVELRAAKGAALLIEVPDGETVLAVPTSDDKIMRGPQPGATKVVLAVDDGEGGQPQQQIDGNLSVAVRGPTVVLKPHGDLLPQPFFVLTERQVGERRVQTRYRFRLATVSDREAFYSVRLRNVGAENADRAANWERMSRVRNRKEAEENLQVFQSAPCASTPNANYRYVGQGAAQLAPSEVCDNGKHTFMRFPGSQKLPAFQTVTAGGAPSLPNWTALKDGWIQLDTYSPTITLLQDEKTALCLHNRGYNPQGTTTGTDTISPGVIRVPAEGRPMS